MDEKYESRLVQMIPYMVPKQPEKRPKKREIDTKHKAGEEHKGSPPAAAGFA